MEEMTPGTCRNCTAPILWVRRPDNPDRFARPLDAASAVKRFVFFEGQLQYLDTYDQHRCADPTFSSQVAVANATKRKATRGKPPPAPKGLTYGDLMQRAVETIVCPYPSCGARPFDECLDVPELADPNHDTTPRRRVPHAVRIKEAWEQRGDVVISSGHPNIESNIRRMVALDPDNDARQAKKVANRIHFRGVTAEENAKIIDQTTCPTCNATPGSPCVDLGQARKGVERFNNNPHPARSGEYRRSL